MSNVKESEERKRFRQEFKEFCGERQRQYDKENEIHKVRLEKENG